MKMTNVFDRNFDALTDGKKHVVNQGSARSSKTYSILQLLYFLAEKSKQPLLISVVSQSLPHLKRGAIRDFQNFLKSDDLWNEDNWRRGDLIYSVGKSQIEFFSVDNAGKVYGPARDYLFMNESNRIDWEIYLQLSIRTRSTCFSDFNPTHEFWAHSELIPRPDVAYIHSTFRDNDYLEESIKNELIEAGKRNENFRRVFVEGEIGVIEGVVFDNWSEGEAAADQDLPRIFGMDFGFSQDPTALVEVKIDNPGKRLYLRELLYKPGLNTDQIGHLVKAHAGGALVIADSAEPRLISELQAKGINVRPAVKGQGSISAGISLMQSFELIVHPESHNLKKELRNYVFLDKGSRLTIDAFNHLIDAGRYACSFYFDKSNFQMPISTYKLRPTRI
jgi:phage terminase large subunit